MTRIFRQFGWLLFTLALTLGCQSREETHSPDEESDADLQVTEGLQSSGESLDYDLRELGLAYHGYQVSRSKSPSNWEDLITSAEEQGMSADAIRRVRDAGYTVIWDMKPGDPDAESTVLAQPPGEGSRLMADGRVEH